MREWLRGVPPGVLAREALLAALPALLTLVLLLLATQPTYDALIRGRNGWTPYAYQGLVQDVQAYHIARLTPGLDAQEVRDARDRALSSAHSPGQFASLVTVEGYGEARLSQVERYLLEDTASSAALASEEAVQLSAQASNYSKDLGNRYVAALRFMRRALLGTAITTGLLSMLLTARALLLWRSERDRRTRREARQREALRLASHELRRPLQALLLASDLLKAADTPAEQQRLLSLIEDSAMQLASRADLTRLNDLYLDVTLRVTRTDLCPLLQRFTAARVSVSVPDHPVEWLIDADRIRQVVENLVENALKYTTELVEVSLREVQGQPEIEVRDFGPGLSAAEREKVFLPYEHGPRGLRDGQGLGLSLARRYARAHGGDVTLTSAPGGGLCATVRLGEPSAVLSEVKRNPLLSGQ